MFPIGIFTKSGDIRDMLITPAFAQSSGGLAEGGFGLLPIIL